MRAKSVALLVLALGCGLVASIGITKVLAKRKGEPVVAPGETQTIFVAMKEISVGEPLASQDLRLEQWPKDKIPPGALTRIEDVEGRRTRGPLYPGEPILEKKLFGKGDKDQGPSILIPKGYRVYSVRVDDVSGGGALIQPGDRVDLLLFLAKNSRDIHKTITRTILQNIKVFAVNDEYQLNLGSKQEKKVVARTIRLLVTPVQAEVVGLANELGKIRLVLRSPLEDVLAHTPGASPSDLFGRAAAGNRENESLIDQPESGSSKAGTSFRELLEKMRAKEAANQSGSPITKSPKRPNTWIMRHIKGAEVSEVVLEETEGNGVDQASDVRRWTQSASPSGFDVGTAEDTPHTDAPVAEEDQQPPKEKEEKQEEED